MAELGFVAIYNTSYSPEQNPIETVFAKVKNHFKALMTNAIVNKKTIDTRELIK